MVIKEGPELIQSLESLVVKSKNISKTYSSVESQGRND